MLIYQIAVFNAAKVIIMKQYSKYFASQHGIFSFFPYQNIRRRSLRRIFFCNNIYFHSVYYIGFITNAKPWFSLAGMRYFCSGRAPQLS